jgi:hypothetical protein
MFISDSKSSSAETQLDKDSRIFQIISGIG